MIIGKNIKQKQGFFDINIGKRLFCFRLQPKSCPKGAIHLLRECGSFVRLVRQKSLSELILPADFFLLLAQNNSHHTKQINEYMT
jgi:hypothetical protein